MKYLPLFWANLRRKPVRTSLTFASIVVAFLLFGLLQTLQSTLVFGADLAGVDRLATMHRVSLIQSFPRSYLSRISAIDGVAATTSFIWFGGIYQDERNQLSTMTTDPDTFFDVYPEYTLPPEQKAAWLADRASMIVGTALAERFGWKVGDVVPLRSSIYTKEDGSSVWDLKVAGIYDAGNGDNSSLYFHYDYLNESRNFDRDTIGYVVLRTEDPARNMEIANAVDALFANSPAETKTSTESAFIQGFANQMGDIGAIVTAVAGAVFFTLLLVIGNTMAQTVRERVSEIGVLKTLGFSGVSVSTLILSEAFVITAAGGALGLLLATGFAQSMSAALAQFFPVIGVPSSTYVIGAVLIVTLSAAAGLMPALQAWRLKITDALRKA